MLLIVFPFVLSFIFFAVSKLFDEYDWKNLVLSILGCFFAAVFVVSAIIAIAMNIFAKGEYKLTKEDCYDMPAANGKGYFEANNDWDEGQPLSVIAWMPKPVPYKE